MKHVILGAGAAGISAASAIRELRPSDEIVIISTDDAVYSRCMLHHYISGERNQGGISFISDDFFAKNNIRWLMNKAVTGVDAGNRLVSFAGSSESFDKLLIATGADNIHLPVLKPQNAESASNVFGLRHLSDAKAIRDYAKNAENIVIIGAGLTGLDAAYALVGMGKKPVVIDISDTILTLNLDSYAANTYKNKFEEAGCVFRLGQKANGADAGVSGDIVSITLDSGEKQPCDMAIVAIGTRPAVGFLADSGIACDGGVKVNECLATNIDGIYAAGDVTGLSGIWPNAVKQGEVAAKNMCGVPTVYDDIFAVKNTINYFGIPSLSVGETEPCEGDIVDIRRSKSKYEKIILRDGVVVGVILQGDISHSGFWQFLIKKGIDVSKINKPVFDISFADFYGIRENGEYQWVEKL